MDSTAEVWKPAVGYEGSYSVSSLGNVRGLNRVSINSAGQRRNIKGKLLRPFADRSGHLRVEFPGRTVYFVHRLVAAAFIGQCPDGMEVCHKDGDPANNRVGNLRYGTRSDNVQDMLRHGTHKNVNKLECPRGHALKGENLAQWDLARGYRKCRSCQSTHSRVSKRPELKPDFQEISDSYYSKYSQSMET